MILRGEGHYSPGAVKIATSPLDLLKIGGPAPAEQDAINAYYRYYAIDFRQRAEQHIGWLSSSGEQIAVQLFVPPSPKGTVVFCHGYYDHVGLFRHLFDYLLEQRLAVVAFDQLGHGLSTGSPATIESFSLYVQVLQDVIKTVVPALPQPWHLFAQSMGGAVTMEYLAEHPLGAQHPFQEIVLFAPLVRPAFWSVNSLVFQIAKRTITERPRVLTNNAENPEFLALMRKDPLQAKTLPVQWVSAMVEWMTRFEQRAPFELNAKIIQGQQDKTVGWRYNMKVLNRLFTPQILYLPNGRHHLANESDGLREQIWHWLSANCRW